MTVTSLKLEREGERGSFRIKGLIGLLLRNALGLFIVTGMSSITLATDGHRRRLQNLELANIL